MQVHRQRSHPQYGVVVCMKEEAALTYAVMWTATVVITIKKECMSVKLYVLMEVLNILRQRKNKIHFGAVIHIWLTQTA